MMRDETKVRAMAIAKHFISTRQTVRQVAEEFGLSKNAIHVHLTRYLPEIDSVLADMARAILDYHKSVRHLRAGEATRIRWAALKKYREVEYE